MGVHSIECDTILVNTQSLTLNASNYRTIPELVEANKLDNQIVDTAVSRLLLTKFEMGLFENPFSAAPPSEWWNLINTPAHQQVARDLDKESIVLLENHNNTLPLKKSGSIALIGPFASGVMNVRKSRCQLKKRNARIDKPLVSSTVTMSYTTASIAASHLWLASQPQSGTVLPSIMLKGANPGATTSQVSPRL